MGVARVGILQSGPLYEDVGSKRGDAKFSTSSPISEATENRIFLATVYLRFEIFIAERD